MFQRIAIVNRGEAAMRLIHAVRDLNAEHPDRDPITTIALFTDAERSAMFAREADEAYPLGPASERPYLNHELLARVLTDAKADAVWVGWGFVAEDASFADLVEGLGITFIGPSGDAMRKLGDKIGSKLIAEEVGVPVAPWSRGGVDTLDEALAAAERILCISALRSTTSLAEAAELLGISQSALKRRLGKYRIKYPATPASRDDRPPRPRHAVA